MITMHFERLIDGSPERIFAIVADIADYPRWLPGSLSFGGTTDISPLPVTLGTTYEDGGSLGLRRGTVTKFEPPTAIWFHQPMSEKRGPMKGTIDILVRYAFAPDDGGKTWVTRDIDLDVKIETPMQLFAPIIVEMFRFENDRVLRMLQKYAAAHSLL